MPTDAAPLQLGAFAFQVLERLGGNDWLVLQVEPGQEASGAERLCAELEALDDARPPLIAVMSAHEWLRAFQQPETSVVVVAGVERLTEADWDALDLARTALTRKGSVVVVASRDGVAALLQKAPNLASWIGGSMFKLAPEGEMSTETRDERLQALREKFGKADAEVIAMAERHELPPDPSFAEWLVLLDRGDLLG